MDKDEKSSGGLPGNGLIMLVLLAAGVVFVANKPLESSRPTQPEQRVERSAAAQDTDARLWQDPFAVVAKARERAARAPGGAASDAAAHTIDRFANELLRQHAAGGDGGALVLAVTLSGGPYAERSESRLRTRHAVLSGLAARGYVPVDSEHVGYFYTGRDDLPETVPYEAFEPSPEMTSTALSRQMRVVVLWLDSSAFYVQPLRRLTWLAQKVSGDLVVAKTPLRWRIVGPSSSDGLRAIVRAADDNDFDAEALSTLHLSFMSPAATVTDALLLRDLKGPVKDGATVASFLADRRIELLRSTGTDDQLADALIKELSRRGLRSTPRIAVPDDPCDDASTLAQGRRPSTVAIVSEWDTLYGRSLRRQFRYALPTWGADGRLVKPEHPGFCVTRWHYVRGIDGRLPGDAAPATADARKPKKDGDANDLLPRDGSYDERPEGQSQFDYLRRLALRIRDEDNRLRREYGPDNGIRAIGVLGNDVYDKLLVLQALQSELPHAIFFTTDLDARLFHPAEQAWARNLLVAANFGLRLDDRLQREIAPFRDSYQTAAYLGTLLAVADAAISIDGPRTDRPTQAKLKSWFERPRLFEIARGGAFDYSPPDIQAGDRCRRGAIQQCRDVQPPGSDLVPPTSRVAVFLLATVLLAATWVPALALSRTGKRRLRRFVARGGGSTANRGLRAFALALAALALLLVPPLWLADAWPAIAATITHDGKPLTLFDGISPWPTYAIRVATLVLCLYMVWRGWAALANNINDIARDLRLGATRRHLNAALAAEERRERLGRVARCGSMLSLNFYRERPGLLSRRDGMTPKAEAFWKHFLVQNRACARLLRTLLCVLAMSCLTVLITQAFGEAPASPQRGDWSRTLQWLSTWPTGLAIQFLIFFIADASLLCVFFIHGLRLHDANWPQRTLQAFEASTGVPAAYLDDWIDLQFIVQRTQVIGRLIYYPFIVLSLMLVARSSFFDDWNSPPSVYVVATLCYAIVLGCALALRLAAEASRRQASERLRDGILRAKGAGSNGLAGQLELLRGQVDKLADGAFAPYSRQPLLKAVLLPLLTFGGSSLFDYLTLVNL